MRWYILRTLLYKEALRHATNKGGLLLAGLLVTASLLMAVLNPAGGSSSPLVGGIQRCIIHYEEPDSALVADLKGHVPADLKNRLDFQVMSRTLRPKENYTYPPGWAAIQIRRGPSDNPDKPRYLIWIWYPPGDRGGMAPYEQWFWRETYRYLHEQAVADLNKRGIDSAALTLPDLTKDELWDKRLVTQQLSDRITAMGGSLPEFDWAETPLSGSLLDMRAAIATALVMFALFFTCVYLMPSLTCEERERGLLLAQALSPARVREILAAKFFFYPTFGILLATILTGIHNPGVLINSKFWVAMFSMSLGSLGIGMTIASLARTQRSASLAALCYMLVVAIVLLVCQQNNLRYIPYLSLEYHAPQVLHALLTNQDRNEHWLNLLGCVILAVGWVMLAGFLFRKRGWQ